MKILTVIEFFVYSGSFLLAMQLEQHFELARMVPVATNILLIYAIIFALASGLFSLSLGLYNPKLREPYRAIFRRIVIAVAMGGFTVTFLTLGFDNLGVPMEVSVLAVGLGIAIVGLVRYLDFEFEFLAQRKISVLVLGAGERASIIERRMKRRVDRQRFDLHGFVVMRGDSPTGIQKEKKLTLEGQSLADYIAEHDIDELIVACDERRNNLPLDLLFDCKIRGTNIIEILDFIERETGQVAVNLVYPSWVIYSNGFSSTNDLRNALDWSFNAVLSLALLIFAWPLMLFAWLAIKIEDGIKAPTLFFQERVGLDGRVFPVIKFRSMRLDAEKYGAVWATRDDPRVTRIGRFLRKYRVDELPQLYNVMRGDMGFVGPRPERPEFVKDLIMKIPYYNQRHNVKPGLTGWAQLKYPYGASEEDALEKLKYDLYYVKHRSFLLDLNILVQRVEVVLFGKGR
jgi:sugar transferase (PEP-CTERM system associated)